MDSHPLAGTESDRQAYIAAQPVVLRLRHVGKTYDIANSTEKVVALKDMHLAETNSEDDEPRAAEDAAATAETTTTPGAAGVSGTPEPARRPPAGAFGPVRRGEFVMIRGPSGGGKTTLLNIIGTIDHCTEGTVELEDQLITVDSKEGELADFRLQKLGFVFQTFNLLSTMTAAENVELPMTLLGKLNAKERRLRARQLLTLVGLRNRVDHLPSELSGGEQQRVTIARSLANNPLVLLLDEPTGDLDTYNTIEVMDLLIQLNRATHTTLLMVTHNPDLECYADRVLHVSDGQFVSEVRNAEPNALEFDAYNRYLDEQEMAGTQEVQQRSASLREVEMDVDSEVKRRYVPG